MTGEPKFTKGAMGYMLDGREALGRVAEISKQMCVAFDLGDQEAVSQLGELFNEACGDVAGAFGKVAQIQGGSDSQ